MAAACKDDGVVLIHRWIIHGLSLDRSQSSAEKEVISLALLVNDEHLKGTPLVQTGGNNNGESCGRCSMQHHQYFLFPGRRNLSPFQVYKTDSNDLIICKNMPPQFVSKIFLTFDQDQKKKSMEFSVRNAQGIPGRNPIMRVNLATLKFSYVLS